MRPAVDAELLLHRLLDVDLGDHAEALGLERLDDARQDGVVRLVEVAADAVLDCLAWRTSSLDGDCGRLYPRGYVRHASARVGAHDARCPPAPCRQSRGGGRRCPRAAGRASPQARRFRYHFRFMAARPQRRAAGPPATRRVECREKRRDQARRGARAAPLAAARARRQRRRDGAAVHRRRQRLQRGRARATCTCAASSTPSRPACAAAGGVPMEFGVMGICDGIAMNHLGMHYSLPSRELIADTVESMTIAHAFDALVLVPCCDKIVPGMLMAAMRLNVPAIMVGGGADARRPPRGPHRSTSTASSRPSASTRPASSTTRASRPSSAAPAPPAARARACSPPTP